MTKGPPPPPPSECPPELNQDVVLHYVDKAHDSFIANRAFANRVLVAQTVIALVVIGIVIGAAEGQKFTVGSSDFSIEVWAVLLAGAVFLALTPGFVIGRLLYNANLAKEMQNWYARLEPQLGTRTADPAVLEDTAVPWEVAPLVSEAGWASARVFKKFGAWIQRGRERKHAPVTERLGTAADFVGGPLTFVVLFTALPVSAQVFAGVWWVKTVDSSGWGRVIGLGVVLLVLITLASIFGAAWRLKTRWERARVLPVAGQDADQLPSAG